MARKWQWAIVMALFLGIGPNVRAQSSATSTETGSASDAASTAHPKIKGHEYVDLGLSVKWAATNVGADIPTEDGYYFAWGEVDEKPEFWTGNCKTYDQLTTDIKSDPDYDAARAAWGKYWRMPTQEEVDELCRKCKWEWTVDDGKNGYRVTGPNGRSIFLPAAGWRSGGNKEYAGTHGVYWSSVPSKTDNQKSYGLFFSVLHHNAGWINRCNGRSVRPVTSGKVSENF